MIVRTFSCVLAFIVAFQASPEAPATDILGFTVFGIIVGAIVGLAKIAEVLIGRRNGRNGRHELRRLADCLEKVESALTAQTSILALVQERQKREGERMREVAEGIQRIERKSA